MTSSPGCRHGDVTERSSRSSTGDGGKKLSGVSENMPSLEVCETCLAPQILASTGPKERLLTLKMNGQPQPSEKTSPTGKMAGSASDHQVASTKTPSPLSQQQCIVGKSSRGSSNTSLASIKDHVTQLLANGKSPSSNSLSDQRATERKSSRSSEHERKSSRSSDQNRIIISNNNEPLSDSNEVQNLQQQQQQRVSVGEIKVTIQEDSSESTNQNTESLSTNNSACLQKENTVASNDINTQDNNVHKQTCDTSLQRTMETERTGDKNGEHSDNKETIETTTSSETSTTNSDQTKRPKDLPKDEPGTLPKQQTIVISGASPEHPGDGAKSQGAEVPSTATTTNTSVPPPLSPSKVKALTGVIAAKDTLTSGPTTSFSQRLLQRKLSQGKKGAGNNSGNSSSGRRLCDEEDELSEVEPDAVPSEVRDWLALTFTRSMSNIKRRGDDKPKFRSVAHAIRAGIMVDR